MCEHGKFSCPDLTGHWRSEEGLTQGLLNRVSTITSLVHHRLLHSCLERFSLIFEILFLSKNRLQSTDG